MAVKKILIVDDDPDIRHGLGIRLSANNYDVVFAGDGFTAINITREEKPDLILLDIGLHRGDGFVVMQRLRENANLAMIPVIVISALDPRTTRDPALAAGAKTFFSKPVDNNELLAAVRKTIGDSPVAA